MDPSLRHASATPRGGVELTCQNPAPMKSQAKRTLVKSPPELWELADDMPRMETWMGKLVGTTEPVRVDVTHRRPERMLAWRMAGAAGEARIALELAEKGFGTSVSITAEHGRPNPNQAEAALEQLLDELGSPERRPFARR